MFSDSKRLDTIIRTNKVLSGLIPHPARDHLTKFIWVQSIIGTSNFGTKLWTSGPISIEMLTSAPCKMITCAEVNLCRSSSVPKFAYPVHGAIVICRLIISWSEKMDIHLMLNFSIVFAYKTTVYGQRSRLLMRGSSFANWVASPLKRGTLLLERHFAYDKLNISYLLNHKIL